MKFARLLILFLLLTGASAARGGGESLSAADENFGLAGALFERGRFEEAAEQYAVFTRRHATDPRAAEASFRRAESLYRAGNSRLARVGFERCLEMKLPADRLAAARMRIGTVLYAAGDFEAAEKVLAAMDPSKLAAAARPAAHYFRGATRLALGREKECAADLAAAAASDRAAIAAPSLLALARLSTKAGRGAEAAGHLAGLLERFPAAPQAPEAAFRLAEIHRADKKPKEALELYEKVLKGVEPGPLAARAALGAAWASLDCGAPAEAIKSAALAAKNGETAEESAYVTGLALMASGRAAEARKAFAGIRGTRAEDAACRAAWCAYLAGDHVQVGLAAREFRARFPESPRSAELRHVEGLAAEASGDSQGALAALDAAAADPKSPFAAESAYRAALVCEKTGKGEETRARLERLVKDHPRHRLSDPALVKLGQMLLAAGKPEEADGLFAAHEQRFPKSKLRTAALMGRALVAAGQADWTAFETRCKALTAEKGRPEAAEAAFWLAWLHERKKTYDRAVTAYEEVIKDHKSSPLIYEFKFRLCCALYLNGNYPKAAEGFLALARSGKRPLPAETLLWIGDYLRAAKREKESAEVYALAAASPDPGTRREASLALAHLAMRAGRAAEAAGLYRKLVEENPEGPRAEEIRLGLAGALRLADKPEEALKAANRLLASKNERIRLAARGEAALAELALGRAADAARKLAPLAVLYDDAELAPRWLAGLAAAAEANKNEEEALRWHRELIKRYPASPEAAAASKKTNIPLPAAGGEPGRDF